MTSFNNINYNYNECVLEQLDAMRMREENTARCRDYFTPQVDATYRKLMVDWCFIVADAFALSRETVCAAVSIFDRYFSSGKGQSHEALKCMKKYQMAVIASFFVAMKLHEPESSVLGITSFLVAMKHHEPEPSVIGMQSLVKLCLGVNEESDILNMEDEILSALEWRVYAFSTTPMEYVRHYVAVLLPMLGIDIADLILDNAAKRTYFASLDVYFSACRASSVGMACLMGAIDEVRSISSSDKEAIRRELTSIFDWDIQSEEIREIEKHLRAGLSRCKFRLHSSRTSVRQSSSLGSVGLIMRCLWQIAMKEVFLLISLFSLLHSLRAQLNVMLPGKLHRTQDTGGMMMRKVSDETYSYDRIVVNRHSSPISCCC
jgi:hypothetical protein